ncbi:hypothetical protein JB92DRAFT_1265620 [Gautieria morchelliformis]|nr:hypothetical protein JB92DRAFT_1265620 [Gautieria morchelliformis]
MSPHSPTTLSPHTALRIVPDTAPMPTYKIARRRREGDAFDQASACFWHASTELLSPLHASFCSTLQHSARFREPLRLLLLCSRAHARHRDVASSRPCQPRPAPRSRDGAPCGARGPVGGAFAEPCRGWRWRGAGLKMFPGNASIGAVEDSFDEGFYAGQLFRVSSPTRYRPYQHVLHLDVDEMHHFALLHPPGRPTSSRSTTTPDRRTTRVTWARDL